MSLEIHTADTLRAAFERLQLLEPKPVTCFVPSNAEVQKKAFIDGEIDVPNHEYDKLSQIDFDQRKQDIEDAGDDILSRTDIDVKYHQVYEQFVDSYYKKTRFMELAALVKASTSEDEKNIYTDEFMQLNRELYATPDELTYRSLLAEKLSRIDEKQLEGTALQLRTELHEIVGITEPLETLKRFQPSSETILWAKNLCETLYSGMLSHVPNQPSFSKEEVQSIFAEIIQKEFGEAADGWSVDIEPAKSLNVKSVEKRVVIPDTLTDFSYEVIRKLIVHELGVHVLRAITGNETDLLPLANGLSDYYDSEEGLGVVMEQALMGKYREAGIDLYIAAGAAYFDKMNFRTMYELKWRLSALNAIGEKQDLDTKDVARAKSAAYGGTMRCFRGTDSLPWFKDLSYYNGAVSVWKHLESIKGDDIKTMFLLMGKADPASVDHERILYETSTK